VDERRSAGELTRFARHYATRGADASEDWGAVRRMVTLQRERDYDRQLLIRRVPSPFLAPLRRRSALEILISHKMALVTLAVVYPLSLTLGVLANRWLAPLAPALRSLVASAMMIVLMTWVIMPRVTRLLRRWLYPPD